MLDLTVFLFAVFSMLASASHIHFYEPPKKKDAHYEVTINNK